MLGLENEISSYGSTKGGVYVWSTRNRKPGKQSSWDNYAAVKEFKIMSRNVFVFSIYISPTIDSKLQILHPT